MMKILKTIDDIYKQFGSINKDNVNKSFFYLYFFKTIIQRGHNKRRELSVDNIQLAYGGISRIRASYYKDREGKPLHMYIYLKEK